MHVAFGRVRRKSRMARMTQMTRIIGRVMPVGVGDNCLKQDLQDL